MQEGQTVAARIMDVLSDGKGRTAHQLSKALNIPRPLINRTLYHSLKERAYANNDMPPVWHAYNSNVDLGISEPLKHVAIQRNVTMVYIDLGNVHDCFKRACVYACYNDNVCVMGVADANYNNWKPSQQEHPLYTDPHLSFNTNETYDETPANVRYERVGEYLKDGAELLLYTHLLSDLAKHALRIERIILCSKDKSVATMKYLLETHIIQGGPNEPVIEIVHVQGWDGLRVYLE